MACQFADPYTGTMKLTGKESKETLIEANNLAVALHTLKRFAEAKSFQLKTMSIARRVLGDDDDITLKMRSMYARALHDNPSATLDDLRESVETLEDTTRIGRRVMGGAHPLVETIENDLRHARATLARETPSPAGNA